jgi:hypothetical protein
MREADFQKNVVELAQITGWRIHHDRGDYRECIAGDPGFPDLVIARRGLVHFMELKSDRGVVSEHQRAWIEELRVGARYSVGVYRPSDIDMIGKILSSRAGEQTR